MTQSRRCLVDYSGDGGVCMAAPHLSCPTREPSVCGVGYMQEGRSTRRIARSGCSAASASRYYHTGRTSTSTLAANRVALISPVRRLRPPGLRSDCSQATSARLIVTFSRLESLALPSYSLIHCCFLCLPLPYNLLRTSS